MAQRGGRSRNRLVDDNFTDSIALREWIDEIALSVVRSICTHHILHHHPRSYEEARTKVHIRRKIPTTAKVYDHPLDLVYNIPEFKRQCHHERRQRN